MARVEIVRCSVIKYRRGDYVLYPLGRDKEKIKHLHGKEVYVLIVAEGITSPNTNLYKTRNSCVRLQVFPRLCSRLAQQRQSATL